MSYEQLAASVDALAEANRSLTEQSLETQAGSIAASDNATAKALEAAQAALSAEDSARVATDAANLAKDSTDIMDSTAAGIAAGKPYFYTLSPDSSQVLVLWKNNEGVAEDTGKRTPSNVAVTEPKWAGKKNGWADPFFRVFDLTSQKLLGLDSWWANTGTSGDSLSPLQQGGWTRVKNTFFDGYSLRRNADAGIIPLSGPVITLTEIDAKAGDTVSVFQLFSGSGAEVSAYVRFDNGSDRGYVGPQIGLTTDAGAATLISTSEPKRMKGSFVVPVGAKRIALFSYTATPAKTFDIMALWSFKGGLTEGPSWPTLEDNAVSDYELRAVINKADTTEKSVTYAIDQYSKVEATAETITLDGTGYSTNPRDLVFMGWGEVYSPSGVTFNALRVKTISRTVGATAKWKTLGIVVKTGPSPETSSGVVLAVGSAVVLEQDDSLVDVTFILKDPTTGQVKTLTNANFTDGKYFIGVWGNTRTGAGAACGEPRGTMPNSLLQAYYHQSTVNAPISGTWNGATAGANNRQAFQHLNLTDPVEITKFTPSQELVAAINATPTVSVPDIVLPPYMYAVQGRESNLYYDNVFLCPANQYDIDLTATGGMQQNERLTWIPTGAVTTGTSTFAVRDIRSGATLVSPTFQQRAAAASAGTGVTKKCLFIGDSLIAANTITQTLLDIAAEDPMKITLLGTQGTGTNKHEGRGGWTVASYTSAGVVSYRFTVSGVTEIPAINAAEYSHNGAVYRVQETNITGGAGTIVCSVVSGGAPLATGTLTKTNSAAGDATIAFSASSAVSGNPFWIGGQVNFGQYLTNNTIDTPDWVVIGLGINDVFSATSDTTAVSMTNNALTQLDVLITSIKAANPSIRVALMLPTPPSSDQDSFGANYATGQTRARFKRNILLWSKQLISRYKSREADRIYILPSNINLDTVNNMQRAALAPVNSRAIVKVERQSNGVHPGSPGYKQIADAIFAFLKCLL